MKIHSKYIKCIKVFLFIFLIVLCILTILYIFLNKYDQNISIKDKPIIYKNLNIELLKKYDFNYFIKNHGDLNVLITYSKPDTVDMLGGFKKMTLREYCLNVMKNHPEWYFKTEDEYDFLAQIGIKNNIVQEFDKLFNHYNNIVYKDTSFWMGAKNSTTCWHTDIDDLSYLYIVKGKKRIHFINPKYNSNMYAKNVYTAHSKWSNINFKDVDYKKYPKFKDVEIETYTLNEGDAIYIPKNWWHCVENLEDSIGITYKLYRPFQSIYTVILEKIRKVYYIISMQNIKEREECIKDLITKEEYQKYSEAIIKNNYENIDKTNIYFNIFKFIL